MLKELKYPLFLLVIFLFIFFTLKYYFSDNNIKNSFRSKKQIAIQIEDYSKNLIFLNNNTKNIVEYVKKTTDNNKKNYYFWELINHNE